MPAGAATSSPEKKAMAHGRENLKPAAPRFVGTPDEARASTRDHLRALAPNAPTRRLDLAIELFRRTVAAWGEDPPTGEELARIRDHIVEVLQLAS